MEVHFKLRALKQASLVYIHVRTEQKAVDVIDN